MMNVTMSGWVNCNNGTCSCGEDSCYCHSSCTTRAVGHVESQFSDESCIDDSQIVEESTFNATDESIEYAISKAHESVRNITSTGFANMFTFQET